MMSNPFKSFKEVAVLVAAEWRSLPADSKQPYEALSNADKKRFEQEKRVLANVQNMQEGEEDTSEEDQNEMIETELNLSGAIGSSRGAGARAAIGYNYTTEEEREEAEAEHTTQQLTHQAQRPTITPRAWKNHKRKNESQSSDEREKVRQKRWEILSGGTLSGGGAVAQATIGTQTEESILPPIEL